MKLTERPLSKPGTENRAASKKQEEELLLLRHQVLKAGEWHNNRSAAQKVRNDPTRRIHLRGKDSERASKG